MRIFLLHGLVVSSFLGCVTSEPAPSEQAQLVRTPAVTTIPTSNGSWVGHYVVPAPSSLSTAATFNVPEVEWEFLNGVATIHYDLPVGLVGGPVSVSLSGPMSSGATVIQLTTGSGTGSCTAQGNIVTCSETFGDLGNLPMNPTVVQQTATQDSVPPASRMQVANLFGADPIGTVSFDLTLPADDDHSGHGGGGGGHGGPGHH
jgi:hypothetical protein